MRGEAFRDTSGPGKQGVQAMLRLVEQKQTKKSARDRVLLRLLYDLALRCGEVISLDVADVNLEQGTVAVRGKGKTSKQILTLPEPTKAALKMWLEARGTEPGALFTNFDRASGKGNRLTRTGLYRLVRGYGQVLGLNVGPHKIRHTSITEACKAAADNGIGLEEVLDYSRHSRKSVAVLMVYRDRERNVQGLLASMVAAG